MKQARLMALLHPLCARSAHFALDYMQAHYCNDSVYYSTNYSYVVVDEIVFLLQLGAH